MELDFWGAVIQETTKAKEGEDRETVLQIRAMLSEEKAAELQRLMGRRCRVSLEDSIAYDARKTERAGQLKMNLDTSEPGPQPLILPAVERDRVLWVQEQDLSWHACLKAVEGEPPVEFYLCGRKIAGGPACDTANGQWTPPSECCPTCRARLADPEPEQQSEEAPALAEPAAEMPENVPDPATECKRCRHSRHDHRWGPCTAKLADGTTCQCAEFAEPEPAAEPQPEPEAQPEHGTEEL